jgi:hypothetical protein
MEMDRERYEADEFRKDRRFARQAGSNPPTALDARLRPITAEFEAVDCIR